MTDQWSGFTILVRTPTGKGERQEGQASWQEQPTERYGGYQQTLWEPTSPQEFLRPKKLEGDPAFRERVFVVFLTAQEQQERGGKGLAIVSRGLAEVYCGQTKLISFGQPVPQEDGVILLPSDAVNSGGRAEIIFNKPGQSRELQIKIGEQTVKEVKIINSD